MDFLLLDGTPVDLRRDVVRHVVGLHSHRAGRELVHALGELVVGVELAGGKVYGEISLDEAANIDRALVGGEGVVRLGLDLGEMRILSSETCHSKTSY